MFGFLLISNPVFADEMEVKTGYGYFVELSTEHIVCKYELPLGKHPLKEGYRYIEVKDKAELNTVEVWHEPVTPPKTEEDKFLDMLKNEDVKDAIKKIKQEQ